MKFKILMIIKSEWLTGGLIHYARLANAFLKRGNEVYFFLISNNDASTDYLQAVCHKNVKKIIIKKSFLIHFIKHISVLKGQINFIHCELSAAHLGFLLGKLLRKPCCITIHHLEERRIYSFYDWIHYLILQIKGKGLSRGFSSGIKRFFLSLSSWPLVFVPSSATAIQVRQWIPRTKNIIVAWNGVDIDLIDSIRAGYKYKQVISVQKLYPEKHVEDQIKAIQKIPDLKLKIVGDGPLKEKLSKMASKKVDVLGYVSEEQKIKLLKESLALVHTSTIEGFCLSIAEALACRLPVVAYDLPALREVFGNTVYYSSPRDIEQLIKNIKRIVRLKPTNEKGRRLIENKYTWDKVAEIEEKALFTILKTIKT